MSNNGADFLQSANSGTAYTTLSLNPNGGAVGIGTTTPGADDPTIYLDLVQNDGSGVRSRVRDTNASGFSEFQLGNDTNKNLGGLLAGGSSYSSYGGPNSLNLLNVTANPLTFGTSDLERMRIDNSGNVGIGTTSPSAKLSVVGSTYLVGLLLATSTVQFSNFGAGTLQTDANGNLSVSSDERLKNVEGTFNAGLAQLEQLTPILYKWKPETGFDATGVYAGFSAQNVQSAIPEAVGQGKDGFLTLQDRPLIAAIVNAVKEIGSISGSFREHLIAWLADAQNGIDKIFAHEIIATNGTFTSINTGSLTASSSAADTITANQKLCLGARCMTAQQFNHILDMEAAAGAPSGGSLSGAPSGSSGPDAHNTDEGTITTAQLKLNGINPAEWPLNQPWQDNLGALFSHADQSETIYSTTTVDVTTAGTTTLEYWAQIPDANWLHTTRDVVVEAAADDNPQPQGAEQSSHDGTAASSTPPAANDNVASTTVATSTAHKRARPLAHLPISVMRSPPVLPALRVRNS